MTLTCAQHPHEKTEVDSITEMIRRQQLNQSLPSDFVMLGRNDKENRPTHLFFKNKVCQAAWLAEN